MRVFAVLLFVILGGCSSTLSRRLARQAVDKDLMSVIDDCCGRGIDFAGLGRNCSDMAAIPDVPYENRASCKAVFMSCCDRQVSHQTCEVGIDHRLFEGSCVGLSQPDSCSSSDKQECCDCCGLGIMAYYQNVPCDRMNIQTSHSCDTAFTTCCLRTKQENEGVSSSTQFPTISPSGGGLCDTAPCSDGCRIVGQTYQCTCPQGYQLAFDRVNCEDLNECNEAVSPCNDRQVCVNEEGGYRCSQYVSCFRGLRFNPVSGNCEDINECEEDLHNCGSLERCRNFYGYFQCVRHTCRLGYELDTSGQCVDVDECGRGDYVCDVGQRCENFQGGYNCARMMSCGTGYTIHAITQECQDIDECFLGTHRCQINQRCINFDGSFECETCPDGYRVGSNNRCTVDIDECLERLDTCGANQFCQNSMGSFSCECQAGYTQDPLSNGCVDVDECVAGDQPCGDHQLCINMRGQYRCQNMCSFGLRFNAYTTRCDDIDECTEGTHRCEGNQECVNQEGSYICKCPIGYRVNQASRTCEDIDECMLTSRACRGDCVNTEGSFYCTCPDGYELSENGFGCSDIDECLTGLHDCDNQDDCFNTLGSFKCRVIDCPEYFDRRLRGNQVICDKVRTCPTPECRNNKTIKISHTELTLPTITYLRSPLRLMTVTVEDDGQVRYTSHNFRLIYGNERGYFQVQRRYVRGAPTAYVMLVRSIYGPYSTNLHLEISTYYGDRLRSRSIVVIHIDVGEFTF